MRELKQHIVEGDSANHQLAVVVVDEPGAGGACHLYRVAGFDTSTNPSDPGLQDPACGVPAAHSTILFQNGPIKEVGVNGYTHEALLAILIDRMEHFQAGPYAIARGVEGTHEK